MATRSAEVMGIRGHLAYTSRTLVRAARHPATWVFTIVYIVSAITLVITGHGSLVAIELGLAAFLAVLVLITIALTIPAPLPVRAEDDTPRVRERWVWAQLVVLAVVVLFTLYAGMVFNGHAPHIPALFEATRSVYRLPIPLLNPIIYVVIPLILLLVLGARLRGLGFARGRRAWAVSALWAIGPLIGIAIALVVGPLSVPRLLSMLVGNTLQNGPMEEFLWRGAVLTRLRLIVGTPWSVVLSSLAFGVWHIGTNLQSFDGQVVAALAYCLMSQAAIGLAFALLFIRTRNLLAPSIAHVLINTASGLFG